MNAERQAGPTIIITPADRECFIVNVRDLIGTSPDFEKTVRDGGSDCAPGLIAIAAHRAGSSLVMENARLKLHLEGERKLNMQLSTTNGKLSGAVEMAAPISVDAGSWFYPEGDTSSDECRFSPSEVVENYAEGLRDGTKGVCVIERAVSLPDIYAAVRVLTDDERDAKGEDESHVYTLHATLAEAQAALDDPVAWEPEVGSVAALARAKAGGALAPETARG